MFYGAMALALANMSGDVVMTEAGKYEMLLAASRESPRLRMIQPIQRADSDPVQRLLNAFQPGTYVRPHKHPSAGASETVVLLQGELGIVIFDEAGAVTQTIRLRSGSLVDIAPNVWHAMVCLAPDTVIAEFKKGPYDSETDKEFAPWSREDGEDLVRELESLFDN